MEVITEHGSEQMISKCKLYEKHNKLYWEVIKDFYINHEMYASTLHIEYELYTDKVQDLYIGKYIKTEKYNNCKILRVTYYNNDMVFIVEVKEINDTRIFDIDHVEFIDA